MARVRRFAALSLLIILALATLLPGAGLFAATGGDRTWQDESIYFIMTDRFLMGDPGKAQINPDSAVSWHGGDLRGIIEKLDYVKSLGFSAIWITPVTDQTPGGYHGYWTNNFYKVDAHLGDMAVLQELVSKAHAKGIKIIIDVVINHTGYNHPWLTDSAHQGWFHPKCPINFGSQESIENCWLAGLPDLNTENPAVQKYLTDWALWLIDQTGCDGFRLDTARHVPKAFLTQWTSAIKAKYPNFWIIGEVANGSYAYLGGYQTAGLDAVLDFPFQAAVSSALSKPNVAMDRLSFPPPAAAKGLPKPNARGTFIDNHDQPRFLGARPDDAAISRERVALAYLLTSPGTPILYYGTEVGLPGGNDPDNRRDMPWDKPPHPELRDWVAKLNGLRSANAVLRRGDYVALNDDSDAAVYARVLGPDQLAIVALNGTDKPWEGDASLAGAKMPQGTRLIDAVSGDRSKTLTIGQGDLHLSLPPYGVQVWLVAPQAAIPTPAATTPAAPPAGPAPLAPAPAAMPAAGAAPGSGGPGVSVWLYAVGVLIVLGGVTAGVLRWRRR